MTRSTADEAAVPPLPSPKERRRLREAKSLSEEKVAAVVGVTRATVRSWETGRTNPRGRRRALYARLIAPEAAVKPAAKPVGKLSGRPSEPKAGPGAGPEPVGSPKAAGSPTPEESPASEERSASAGSTASEEKPEAEGSPASQERPTSQGSTKAAASAAADLPVEPPPPATPAPPSGASAGTEAADEPGATAQGPGDAGDPKGERDFSPAEAFDALYAGTAPGLVRQTYLLTGRRSLARESVERAFELAWHRWPEVAVDRDPGGWVRAAAYEYAMSPWHRLRRAHRHPDAPPTEPGKRALFDALLDLPPAYRRTLLLYDGVGLDLPETAAETEASTPAAAGRLLTARAAVAERLPDLKGSGSPAEQSALLHDRLGGLARAEHVPVPRPARAVRTGSESKARLWTRSAVAGVALLIAVTGLTLHTAPTHYEPPISPPERVGGVPPRGGPQKLTAQDRKLQKSLSEHLAHGPERLVPELR
ncbi:helix-turn-helix domain-containing protein [Streptomyces sp. YPW6]|uniref:helix-turn-helix domain-containing protein n=1 Tax=Streptomyces sp. YPW6 TaxID=2840373 RepID=UPI001C0BD7C4|nr:helix-turn-helix domain-containing protein [Streptomyces sp. YPW6]QWQ41628.1 helix-turn-helix domain-containing protein [Streptomyces sp. YPW6]